MKWLLMVSFIKFSQAVPNWEIYQLSVETSLYQSGPLHLHYVGEKKKVIPLVFLLVRLQHQFPSSEDFLSDGVLEKCHHKLDYKINVYNSAFYIKGFLYQVLSCFLFLCLFLFVCF